MHQDNVLFQEKLDLLLSLEFQIQVLKTDLRCLLMEKNI